MSIYGGGDDALIRRLYATITVLWIVILLLLVTLLFFFRLWQPLPHGKGDSTCAYTRRPLYTGHYLQITYPVPWVRCRG